MKNEKRIKNNTIKRGNKNSGFFLKFGLKKEVYFFIENLSILISAGLNINSALKSIQEESDSRRMRKILTGITDKIEEGSPLHVALEQSGVFSSRILSLVRVGERSGKLLENLEVVSLQNEKETLFRSKVRSSLMYAIIVFTLAVVVGVGTAWFILPKLASFFGEYDAELPIITRGLIGFGQFLSQYGAFIIPLFAFFVLGAFYFLFSFPKTKFIGHSILFRVPVIKNLIKQVEIARFGYLSGSMLESGMSVVDAIEAMKGTTTFKNYQNFYIYLKEKVETGNSLENSFKSYPKINKLFPSSARHMMAAAEKSGKLSEILLKIGKTFEQKTEATARNLPIVLEPILLIIIGLAVALLALGVILPIYNLSSII